MYRLKVSDSHYTEIGGNIYKMKCKGVSGQSSFKILLLFYRFLKISSYCRKKKCVLLYGRTSRQHYWCQTAACQRATWTLHYDCSPRDLHWTRPRPLTLAAVEHPLFALKYRAEDDPQCPYAPVQSISIMSFGTSTNWYTRRWPSTLAKMPRW